MGPGPADCFTACRMNSPGFFLYMRGVRVRVRPVSQSVHACICIHAHPCMHSTPNPPMSVSDGGGDQGAEEEAAVGQMKRRRVIHVGFGKRRLARAALPFRRRLPRRLPALWPPSLPLTAISRIVSHSRRRLAKHTPLSSPSAAALASSHPPDGDYMGGPAAGEAGAHPVREYAGPFSLP